MASSALRNSLGQLEKRLVATLPKRLQALWYADAGPRTVHFWAPTFKWCLVIAGISDMFRPADKLSEKQSTALAATGMIWARYSLVIQPKNWNLFSVNIFLAITGGYQLYRIFVYKRSLKKALE